MKTLSISFTGLLLFQMVFMFSVLFSVATVSAQTQPPTGGGITQPPTGGGITQPPSTGGSSGSRTIQNPLNGINSIAQFISALLRAVIAIGIPIAILFIVLAGFKFIAAQGSPDKLSEARTNFLYVVIGIAIFIGASALAELVVATLRQIGVNV